MAPDTNSPPPVTVSSIDAHHVRPDVVAIDSHGPEHAPSHIIRIGALGHGVILHVEGRTTAEKLDVIEAIGDQLVASARLIRSTLAEKAQPEAVAS